jgi:hypothetical protein
MARVKIGPAPPDRQQLDAEIARLRDLDAGALRVRWQGAFGRRAPAHLPRHLLCRVLAYRLQADALGDLDGESQRLLDGLDTAVTAGQRPPKPAKPAISLRPGTVLGREWNGHMHRVVVLVEGFAWNGKTFASLSAVASAITGTRWNGPKFFGLRDKPRKGASP